MLSDSKTRKLLGQVNLSEDEVKDIRKQLYTIAEVLVENYLKTKSKNSNREDK